MGNTHTSQCVFEIEKCKNPQLKVAYQGPCVEIGKAQATHWHWENVYFDNWIWRQGFRMNNCKMLFNVNSRIIQGLPQQGIGIWGMGHQGRTGLTIHQARISVPLPKIGILCLYYPLIVPCRQSYFLSLITYGFSNYLTYIRRYCCMGLC